MVSFNPPLSASPPTLRNLLVTDRWRWSLAGSALFHVVLILGIGFVVPKWAEREWIAPLSITLVEVADQRTPQNAAFLAQSNSLGGGLDSSSADAHTTRQGVSQLPTPPLPKSLPPEPPHPAFDHQAPQLLTTDNADPQRAVVETRSIAETPRLAQLRERVLADLGAAQQTVQKGLREKYLGAQTKAYRFAHYMEQWRTQVEEIGNLNYPDEAQRQGLSGTLVLDVAIRVDGTIQNVRVARSSGNKVLDDAAQRIVRLASPFAPFPDAFAQEVDVLHMVRTWEFLHNRLTSQ